MAVWRELEWEGKGRSEKMREKVGVCGCGCVWVVGVKAYIHIINTTQ